MRTTHYHLIAAACLAVLGFSASAQTPQPAVVAPGAPSAAVAPGPMMRPHGPGMQQFMQHHRAEREARLKQILQIAPAQEGAWNAWVAARQPAARQRPDHRELASLPTPERIDRMRALRSARMAEMDRRAEATKTFYAALTPAQQKSFDALAAERMGHMGHHGGGRHGGWMQRG